MSEFERTFRKPLILVADDDAGSRMLVRAALEQSGFEVVEAGTGAEAVAQFAERRPQLILLDVVMPEMDGFQACATIRRLPDGAAVPVLMLTGLEDLDSIRKSYEAGATDFVTKPMNWVILSQRVRYMLRASDATLALQESEARLATAQRIARLGNWETELDDGEVRWSDEMYRIFGVDPAAFTPRIERFLELVHPDDRELLVDAREGVVAGHGPRKLDLRVTLADGSKRVVHEQMQLLPAGNGIPARLAGTTQDISERKHAEEQIRFLAYFDGLTRLPNRILFNDRLQILLPILRRQQHSLAILFLDLDRFKGINDTLGHTAGDRLLQEVSDRFRRCVRATDTIARGQEADRVETVARLGGDEFVVAIPELRRGEDAARVARRILDALERPIELDGHEVVVAASIGISLYPQDGDEVETLLKYADAAMYKAKESGGNRFEFYDRAMTKAAFLRLSLEGALRKALERRELELFFQPQVDVGSGKLVGAEALIRWRNPERGLISPADFIPLAEETGLIGPIGEWVLRRACAEAKTWEGFDAKPLTVAVNLSGCQFQQGQIVDVVQDAVEAAGIDPRTLDVEITESVLMRNADDTVSKLQALRDMGVGVSLDDFGTGYSALSYLKRFPITSLKIDRTFVRDVATDAGDAAITTAIIGIAQGLGLSVIAEGVENETQLSVLEKQGCTLMQGFLFGRPVPSAEFSRLLAELGTDGWVGARSKDLVKTDVER
jgi:diguanylate cyclase (GGDEF)-like protein/PAS domain S-box-containing protein